VTNLLDFIAVKIDAIKAQHVPFTLNINVADLKEVHFVEMSNGNLNNALVAKARKADATLHINKADINQMLLGKTTFKALLKSGKAGIDGDASVMEKLASVTVKFDEAFEVVPRPAKGEEVDADLYQ
ncbi:MAG: SCP2 sterol-binding domain-containing protein, partial [Pseudomonadales bacterium]|nr:SCP2 sterol-binding domain-containing protein [Pseudomonadales bacterium]